MTICPVLSSVLFFSLGFDSIFTPKCQPNRSGTFLGFGLARVFPRKRGDFFVPTRSADIAWARQEKAITVPKRYLCGKGKKKTQKNRLEYR